MDSDSGVGEQSVMPLSDKDICIKCEKGGVLLICSDVQCPISYHKECMPQIISIDNMDNFYCPFCSYKNASMRTSNKDKNKNVLLAKKNLLLFFGNSCLNTTPQKQTALEGAKSFIILGETTCDETTKQNEDEAIVHSGQLENDQEVERAIQADDETTKQNEDEVIVHSGHLENDQEVERAIQADDETTKQNEDGAIVHSGQLENDQEVERAIQADDESTKENEKDGVIVHSGDLENDQEVERAIQADQQEADDRNIPHVEDQTKLESSAESSRKRKCVNDENKKPEMEEHDLQQSSRLRKRKLTSPDEGNIKEKDGTAGKLKKKQKLATGVEKRSVEHKNKTTSSRKSRRMKQKGKTVEHEEEEVQDSLEPSMEKRLIKWEPPLNVDHKEKTTASTSRESKPNMFLREKRKKCLWRFEEEEMLKLGVEKFSTKINKNIPWKKLLEFGRNVFDSSRNSRDLKDKWRNLHSKKQPPPPDK